MAYQDPNWLTYAKSDRDRTEEFYPKSLILQKVMFKSKLIYQFIGYID